jgi:hypothetical protein
MNAGGKQEMRKWRQRVMVTFVSFSEKASSEMEF